MLDICLFPEEACRCWLDVSFQRKHVDAKYMLVSKGSMEMLY